MHYFGLMVIYNAIMCSVSLYDHTGALLSMLLWSSCSLKRTECIFIAGFDVNPGGVGDTVQQLLTQLQKVSRERCRGSLISSRDVCFHLSPDCFCLGCFTHRTSVCVCVCVRLLRQNEYATVYIPPISAVMVSQTENEKKKKKDSAQVVCAEWFLGVSACICRLHFWERSVSVYACVCVYLCARTRTGNRDISGLFGARR